MILNIFKKLNFFSEIPDGYETIDIFRMLMRCLGGCRERRKRREKYNLAQTIELIKKSKKILVLTGAGISVSCGIPDFRSRDGLYAKEGVFLDLKIFFEIFCLENFSKILSSESELCFVSIVSIKVLEIET